jgi:hypothetical protein
MALPCPCPSAVKEPLQVPVGAFRGLTAEEVALMWKTAPPRMQGEPSEA